MHLILLAPARQLLNNFHVIINIIVVIESLIGSNLIQLINSRPFTILRTVFRRLRIFLFDN